MLYLLITRRVNNQKTLIIMFIMFTCVVLLVHVVILKQWVSLWNKVTIYISKLLLWNNGNVTIYLVSNDSLCAFKFMENWLLKTKNNKNTLTGMANWRKTTRHHALLALCAKSIKTNDAKSREWPKTSIWAIFWQFWDQISPNCSFSEK